jgi:hypothetical protein
VACGSAVDIPAPVAPRAYGYVHNRVHNLGLLPLFAAFSRSARLWMVFVVARCGEFPSGIGRRLLAMHADVSSEKQNMHGLMAGYEGGAMGLSHRRRTAVAWQLRAVRPRWRLEFSLTADGSRVVQRRGHPSRRRRPVRTSLRCSTRPPATSSRRPASPVSRKVAHCGR